MSDDPDRWLETGRLAELGLLSTELTHELRQPLFAVKALAQLMAREEGADPRLATMLEQLGHMETVVERWVATGRRPGERLGPVALEPAVQAGVRLLHPRARSAQKALTVVSAGPDVAVLGDAVRIQQITANLVSNALDAARSRVEVRTRGPVLQVEDDGPGIPPEVRARIFEPFFSTKPPGKGTGLGLAITAHLVRGARGTLEVRDTGSGALFEVRFAGAGAAPATGAG
jgi:two-component system sensor histidine kinase AauS